MHFNLSLKAFFFHAKYETINIECLVYIHDISIWFINHFFCSREHINTRATARKKIIAFYCESLFILNFIGISICRSTLERKCIKIIGCNNSFNNDLQLIYDCMQLRIFIVWQMSEICNEHDMKIASDAKSRTQHTKLKKNLLQRLFNQLDREKERKKTAKKFHFSLWINFCYRMCVKCEHKNV